MAATAVTNNGKPLGSANDENDHHDETCSLCGGWGELLVCESCPRVYHLSCVEVRHSSEVKIAKDGS